MSTLEKAISQKELTADTVKLQFCSEWLQDQISDLFTKISLMEEELKWRRGFHGMTGVDELRAKLLDLPTKDQMAEVSIERDSLREKVNAYELLLEESQTGRLILFEQLQEVKEENLEQARLLGMEGSKEARLLAQLEEAKKDALRFGRAMEEERNLRLAFQEALEKLSEVDDTGTGGYMEEIISDALSLLEKKNV